MGSYSGRSVLTQTLVVVCTLSLALSARAQAAVEADAQSVLAAMSAYLGGLKSFSVEFSAVDEVVTSDGQKLQFLHSGDITVLRPNKLYVVRRGATGIANMFLDGRKLTLYAQAPNAYLQLDAPSIAAAVEDVHKLGFDAPGADLLADQPLNDTTMDMTSGAHVGMSYVNGVEAHQLAFRGVDVDWQLWVAAGDKPLPLRYVVTTKSLPGSPQYTLDLRNWNTAPKVDDARFTFAAPDGAKVLDPASVTANAVGDLTLKAK